jgi:hypothetical protein
MNILSDFIIRLGKKTTRLVYKGLPIEELAGEPLDEAIAEYEGILKILKYRKGLSKKAVDAKALTTPVSKPPKTASRKKEKI